MPNQEHNLPPQHQDPRPGIESKMSNLNEHSDANETKKKVEATGKSCFAIAGHIGDEAYFVD